MDCNFEIHYWGVTGSFADPLTPELLLDKITSTVCWLRRRGMLDDLQDDSVSDEEVRAFISGRVPFPLHSTFGGNTTCVEVRTEDALLIIDAGSGMRRLGIDLEKRWNSAGFEGRRTAHVLLTHAHMDHTLATPFFDPYYDGRNNFKVLAPQSVLDSLHAVLSPVSKLKGTYFPPTYESMEGVKQFCPIKPDETFMIGGTEITTMSLNHPGDCVAYRFRRGDACFVFATDHEQEESPDPALAEFARGADLLYLDAQYLESEYEGREGVGDEPPQPRKGWGHTTIEGAVQTAVAAGVRQIHLGHHEPKRTDEGLALLEEVAWLRASESLREAGRAVDELTVSAAREGMEIRL